MSSTTATYQNNATTLPSVPALVNTPTVPFPVLSWSGRQGLVRVQRAFRARPTLTSLAKALLATGLPLQVETVSASTPPAIHPGAVPVAMANANADAHAVADVKNHIWSPRDPTADKFDHLASILQSLGTIRAMGSWLERTSIPYYQVGGGEGGRTSTRKVPSPRVCLSAFMIDAHPEVVLGGRGAEDPTAVAVQGAARALRDAMTALLVPFVAPWAPVQPVRWEVGGRNRDQVPGPTSPRSTATATANATGGWRTPALSVPVDVTSPEQEQLMYPTTIHRPPPLRGVISSSRGAAWFGDDLPRPPVRPPSLRARLATFWATLSAFQRAFKNFRERDAQQMVGDLTRTAIVLQDSLLRKLGSAPEDCERLQQSPDPNSDLHALVQGVEDDTKQLRGKVVALLGAQGAVAFDHAVSQARVALLSELAQQSACTAARQELTLLYTLWLEGDAPAARQAEKMAEAWATALDAPSDEEDEDVQNNDQQPEARSMANVARVMEMAFWRRMSTQMALVLSPSGSTSDVKGVKEAWRGVEAELRDVVSTLGGCLGQGPWSVQARAHLELSIQGFLAADPTPRTDTMTDATTATETVMETTAVSGLLGLLKTCLETAGSAVAPARDSLMRRTTSTLHTALADLADLTRNESGDEDDQVGRVRSARLATRALRLLRALLLSLEADLRWARLAPVLQLLGDVRTGRAAIHRVWAKAVPLPALLVPASRNTLDDLSTMDTNTDSTVTSSPPSASSAAGMAELWRALPATQRLVIRLRDATFTPTRALTINPRTSHGHRIHDAPSGDVAWTSWSVRLAQQGTPLGVPVPRTSNAARLRYDALLVVQHQAFAAVCQIVNRGSALKPAEVAVDPAEVWRVGVDEYLRSASSRCIATHLLVGVASVVAQMMTANKSTSEDMTITTILARTKGAMIAVRRLLQQQPDGGSRPFTDEVVPTPFLTQVAHTIQESVEATNEREWSVVAIETVLRRILLEPVVRESVTASVWVLMVAGERLRDVGAQQALASQRLKAGVGARGNTQDDPRTGELDLDGQRHAALARARSEAGWSVEWRKVSDRALPDDGRAAWTTAVAVLRRLTPAAEELLEEVVGMVGDVSKATRLVEEVHGEWLLDLVAAEGLGGGEGTEEDEEI